MPPLLTVSLGVICGIGVASFVYVPWIASEAREHHAYDVQDMVKVAFRIRAGDAEALVADVDRAIPAMAESLIKNRDDEIGRETLSLIKTYCELYSVELPTSVYSMIEGLPSLPPSQCGLRIQEEAQPADPPNDSRPPRQL